MICVIHSSLNSICTNENDQVCFYRHSLEKVLEKQKNTTADDPKYLKNQKSFPNKVYKSRHRSIHSTSAMPQPPDALAVQGYVDAFAKEEHLSGVGFSFLIDITGTLFKKRKPSLKDMNGNTQA